MRRLAMFQRGSVQARITALAILGVALTATPGLAQQPAPKPAPPKPAAPAPGAAAPAKPATATQRQAAVAKVTDVWKGDLDGMIKRRYIRVATTYNRTNYFIDKGVQRGNVYEAFKLFEDELNTRLKSKHMIVHVI